LVASEWVEQIIQTMPPDNPPAPLPALRSALEAAVTLPEKSAFTTLRVGGPDGDIWLEQKVPGQPVRMIQIDDAANILNTFTVPGGVTVLSVRAGHVWLLELDQHDVPFLRRYRLTN
jgi:hypothetical protein